MISIKVTNDSMNYIYKGHGAYIIGIGSNNIPSLIIYKNLSADTLYKELTYSYNNNDYIINNKTYLCIIKINDKKYSSQETLHDIDHIITHLQHIDILNNSFETIKNMFNCLTKSEYNNFIKLAKQYNINLNNNSSYIKSDYIKSDYIKSDYVNLSYVKNDNKSCLNKIYKYLYGLTIL